MLLLMYFTRLDAISIPTKDVKLVLIDSCSNIFFWIMILVVEPKQNIPLDTIPHIKVDWFKGLKHSIVDILCISLRKHYTKKGMH